MVVERGGEPDSYFQAAGGLGAAGAGGPSGAMEWEV